ncbi:hypothetical protein [Cellulomonas palmilytica]|uniref:hypothetical protein n=1 Tax=Cellulomonas palmilytica TaxID=2608402 RepID=UPI001F1CC1E9|nr:hypothetical protein [Cellulomonas palmilytica]UJP39082.1 hypothetical protein F1D97_12040 [Cellulomonas palmilytica]
MRRLFWVGVGVAVTVVVIRKGRAVAEAYLPQGTTDVVTGASALTRAFATARHEFAAGMAEREAQLRSELVGDVDVDAVRADKDRRVAELRSAWGDARGGARRAPQRERRVPPDWAGPLEDPDDDADAAFF